MASAVELAYLQGDLMAYLAATGSDVVGVVFVCTGCTGVWTLDMKDHKHTLLGSDPLCEYNAYDGRTKREWPKDLRPFAIDAAYAASLFNNKVGAIPKVVFVWIHSNPDPPLPPKAIFEQYLPGSHICANYVKVPKWITTSATGWQWGPPTTGLLEIGVIPDMYKWLPGCFMPWSCYDERVRCAEV
jgi:hypothetical protein